MWLRPVRADTLHLDSQGIATREDRASTNANLARCQLWVVVQSVNLADRRMREQTIRNHCRAAAESLVARLKDAAVRIRARDGHESHDANSLAAVVHVVGD